MNALYCRLKIITCVFLLGFSGQLFAESTAYPVCYFDDGKSVTWKWGLKSDNSWYGFSGNWVTTKYTKIEKFSTNTNYADIYQSCVNSKAYYKLSGNLFAIFAATSNTGSNYPILVGGGELFPQY